MRFKIAAGVQKYHRDLEMRESQTLKEESNRMRRVASQMARMVRDFWSGLQRVRSYCSGCCSHNVQLRRLVRAGARTPTKYIA